MLHSSSRGNFVWEMGTDDESGPGGSLSPQKPSAERVFVGRETLLAPTHLSTIVWGAEKRYVVNSIHVYATLNNSQLAQ